MILLVGTDAVWTNATSTPTSEMLPKMKGAVKTCLLVERLLLPWLCVIQALFVFQILVLRICLVYNKLWNHWY